MLVKVASLNVGHTDYNRAQQVTSIYLRSGASGIVQAPKTSKCTSLIIKVMYETVLESCIMSMMYEHAILSAYNFYWEKKKKKKKKEKKKKKTEKKMPTKK